MNKQRLISIVAVLCLAQLAVIASQQLQDNSSELHSLRTKIAAGAAAVARLFSQGAATPDNPQLPEAQPRALTRQNRSSELAPTMLNDDKPATGTNRLVAKNTTQNAAQQTQDVTEQKGASSRDPFVPFFSIRNNSRGDNTSPLTSYDLSELRLAAIISDSAGNRSASVEATDGKSFIVRVGTKIGDHGGRVETITATSLVISEPNSAAFGSQGATTKELSLKTYPTPATGLAD